MVIMSGRRPIPGVQIGRSLSVNDIALLKRTTIVNRHLICLHFKDIKAFKIKLYWCVNCVN